MNDRPAAAELIAAARHYLETDLIQTLTDPRQRFQTLIAANVLSIVERELESEETQLMTESAELADVLGSTAAPPERLSELRKDIRTANEMLCEHIRRGDFDESDRFLSVLSKMRRIVERKLEIANPKYLAGFRNL